MNFCQMEYEDFKVEFPELVKDVVDYYPSGYLEIIVKLADGRKYAYDFLSKTKKLISKYEPYEGGNQLTDQEWRSEFARRLKRRMHIKGLTQLDLSRLSCISTHTLSKYTNGESAPNIRNVSKLARILECSVAELIDF